MYGSADVIVPPESIGWRQRFDLQSLDTDRLERNRLVQLRDELRLDLRCRVGVAGDTARELESVTPQSAARFRRRVVGALLALA